ncbi:hypothetical protein BANRA_02299 [Pseudomonas aeruginosa]|nr:hypothetical protein BANRA_02299 [Pseudomonas aeruginosa]
MKIEQAEHTQQHIQHTTRHANREDCQALPCPLPTQPEMRNQPGRHRRKQGDMLRPSTHPTTPAAATGHCQSASRG